MMQQAICHMRCWLTLVAVVLTVHMLAAGLEVLQRASTRGLQRAGPGKQPLRAKAGRLKMNWRIEAFQVKLVQMCQWLLVLVLLLHLRHHRFARAWSRK
jgi:hypothetical protein